MSISGHEERNFSIPRSTFKASTIKIAAPPLIELPTVCNVAITVKSSPLVEDGISEFARQKSISLFSNFNIPKESVSGDQKPAPKEGEKSILKVALISLIDGDRKQVKAPFQFWRDRRNHAKLRLTRSEK